MSNARLSPAQTERRRFLATRAWELLHLCLVVDARNETSVMALYRGHYLHIGFDMDRGIMTIHLVKTLQYPNNDIKRKLLNHLNTDSVLGSHAIQDEMGCYIYRSVFWLENELTSQRLLEVLDCCIEEADQGIELLEKQEECMRKREDGRYKIFNKNFRETK